MTFFHTRNSPPSELRASSLFSMCYPPLPSPPHMLLQSSPQCLSLRTIFPEPLTPHFPLLPLPSGHNACSSNEEFAGTLGKERTYCRCRLTLLLFTATPVTQSLLADKNVMDILVFKGRVELQVSALPPILRHFSSLPLIAPIRKLFNTSKRARTCSTTSRRTSRPNLKFLHLPPLRPMMCCLCFAVVCDGWLPGMCGDGGSVLFCN